MTISRTCCSELSLEAAGVEFCSSTCSRALGRDWVGRTWGSPVAFAVRLSLLSPHSLCAGTVPMAPRAPACRWLAQAAHAAQPWYPRASDGALQVPAVGTGWEGGMTAAPVPSSPLARGGAACGAPTGVKGTSQHWGRRAEDGRRAGLGAGGGWQCGAGGWGGRAGPQAARVLAGGPGDHPSCCAWSLWS